MADRRPPGPMPLIAVLNGPNVNMLGMSATGPAGPTLDDLEMLCAETAESLDMAIDFRQSNHEGELITWVQEFSTRAAGLVVNPAGYAASSVALADALRAAGLPLVEVQLANPFHPLQGTRPLSLVSPIADGTIFGFGIRGYALALNAMATLLYDRPEEP